ncbi:hypothetical protein MKW92_028948 [Papaver armeniacum]|nr:hypothetical protein MKW92_028948 [Papaver armeniacum]
MAAMLKLACLVLVCMVAPYTSEGAMSCDTIKSTLTPCLGYLTGGDLDPDCCPGVKSVIAAVQTTSERQDACNCLQIASAEVPVPEINYDDDASLPSKCGVYIPDQLRRISPSTDCTKYVYVA